MYFIKFEIILLQKIDILENIDGFGISTLTSQLFDTIIFSFISFGVGLGWLFDPAMRYQLLGLCVGQYICKAVLALLDTPLFYLFTWKRDA